MSLRRASCWQARLAFLAAMSLGFTAGCAARAPVGAPVVEVQAGPVAAAEASSGEDSSREVIQLLISTQRAYIERADPKPFADLLSPEAKITAARLRAPGAYDTRFTKQRLVHIYEWASRNEERLSAKCVTIKAQVTGDAAEVEMRLETEGSGVKAWFGQTFRLVKFDGAWQIVRFRYYPINPDTQEEFAASFFEEMDRLAAEDLRTGDYRNATYHLFVGYRFDDSAMLARQLTDADPADPWAWEMRAKASAMIGDKEDAEKASQTVRKLKGLNRP